MSALEKCGATDYRACLLELDAARALDPSGEAAAAVRDARAAAEAARTPAPNELAPQQQELTPQYQPTEKQLAPKLSPKQRSLKKERVVPLQLENQQTPLFNDLPSKSNGNRKNLTPTKD